VKLRQPKIIKLHNRLLLP